MSKPPSIQAAMKRLLYEARVSHDVSMQSEKDIKLLCRALTYLNDTAEHVDSSDGQPIYEIKPESDWRAKDLLTAVSEALDVSEEKGQNEP